MNLKGIEMGISINVLKQILNFSRCYFISNIYIYIATVMTNLELLRFGLKSRF